VSGDQTRKYGKGTRLMWTQTTVKYGVVIGSSYASGTGLTTITIAVNTDHVLAAAAITSPYFSYQASPQGYPTWFNFAPNLTGYSAPSVVHAKFAIVGNAITIQIYVTGTSNAVSLGGTFPVATLSNILHPIWVGDNGASQTLPGRIQVAPASATFAIWKDGAGNNFTASGSKTAISTVTYDF
jgi:hypothetical protein